MTNKDKMLLKALGKKPRTANEAIERIWNNDMEKGIERPRKWVFYTHLNKRLAPLEKAGVIRNVGHKKGDTGRLEKLWIVRG